VFRFNLAAVLFTLLGAPPLTAAPPVAVSSPDGRVKIELALRRARDAGGVPHFRVLFRDSEIIGFSRLGIDLGDGKVLGGPCEIVAVESRSRRETYSQFPGKRREVIDHCTEAIVRLRESSPARRQWEVALRAYDDGVAFRYGFLSQAGWDRLVIAGERTEFVVPVGTRAFALPLNGFTTSYEKLYQVKPVGELPKEWLLGLPLLLECASGVWAAITEANVSDYAGLYLAPTGRGRLTSRLSPLPKEPKVAVRASLPHVSPWRVVMVSDRVGRLIESDLVLNLSAPCAIKDTSWIKTGKTTFPWWNGYYEENVAFKPGLNTATMKHYINFCAEAGIPNHSLDGVGSTAWYGGPIVPYEGADITRAVKGLDLPEVLKHAKAKGVRLRLWMHWKAAETHMERAFPLYRDWGIEGVMLDFMDRDDQEMYAFIRRAVKLAADNRLTVTLHGCPKPTGLERTYPNLLTSEGVRNLEYDKWDKVGCPPEHEVTVPFTRMLAGPLDFHQGSFRAVRPEAFKPRNDAPLVMGTPSRTLASYVVFQNHLPMVADYPTAYRGHPALPALADIPTTWDDTRVLQGKPGEYVVIARRSSNRWYVGAMTDRKAREITIPLDFLGAGDYTAKVYCDDLAAKHEIAIRSDTVTAQSGITLNLISAGGAFIRLNRQ
jgi:alpha-glucosidase